MIKFQLDSIYLNSYLIDTSLLIFSEKAENVYGFEKEDAALFLKIDTLISSKSLQQIKKQFSNISENLIENIYNILSPKELLSEKNYSPALNIGTYKHDSKKRYFYKIDNLTFAICYPCSSLFEYIHPFLLHLQQNEPSSNIINIDFIDDKQKWQIYFNNEKIFHSLLLEYLFPPLMENMLIAYSESKPYLISIHSAAIGLNNKVVIMPAVSGSGKSTLTAALMNAGFELYSDEMCTIDLNAKVSIYPLCLNIKEGSWKVLDKKFPKLYDSKFHFRFDNQKLRYIIPENIPTEKKSATHLIFPKYIKDVETSISEITACEAMLLIKKAGYKLQNPLCVYSFEKILTNLLSLPKYKISYSNLDSAIKVIKEICYE